MQHSPDKAEEVEDDEEEEEKVEAEVVYVDNLFQKEEEANLDQAFVDYSQSNGYDEQQDTVNPK